MHCRIISAARRYAKVCTQPHTKSVLKHTLHAIMQIGLRHMDIQSLYSKYSAFTTLIDRFTS